MYIYIYMGNWEMGNVKLIFLIYTNCNYVKLGMCYFWRVIY